MKQTHLLAQQRMLHEILVTIALSAGWTFAPFRMNKQVKNERTDELAENAPHIAAVFSSSYLAMCRIAILLVARP
jgi:hypothetical protein